MSDERRLSGLAVAKAAQQICERTGNVSLIIAGRDNGLVVQHIELQDRLVVATRATSSSAVGAAWHISLLALVAAVETM